MLTERQQELLDHIERGLAQTGLAPTYREMADLMDLRSLAGIHKMILQLEEKDYIRRMPRRARAIEVKKPQTHLNSEFNRGIQEGLRLSEQGSSKLAMVS